MVSEGLNAQRFCSLSAVSTDRSTAFRQPDEPLIGHPALFRISVLRSHSDKGIFRDSGRFPAFPFSEWSGWEREKAVCNQLPTGPFAVVAV